MSRFLRACVVALAAAAVLALPAAAQAGPARIQTQNLYLGSDLTPAVVATTPAAFFAATNQIWANVKASDFPARAERIAREIEANKPDIVALQEVSNWQVVNLSPSSHEQSLDFLAILQSALAARKLDYTVASFSPNANIGPIPLPAPPPFATPAFLLTFQDRDVILVRHDKSVSFSNPQHGNFATQFSITPPFGGPPLSFNRGWASIDAVVDKRAFHFVDSHLEVEGPTAPIQQAQAAELLAGPLAGPGPTIAAGDFNSAADGSTTTSYAQLTSVFSDVWVAGNHPGGPKNAGFTCCQAADLLNPKSQLDERIDLVLTKIAGKQGKPEADVVGDKPGDRTKAGQWPSDHAGLFAQVHMSH